MRQRPSKEGPVKAKVAVVKEKSKIRASLKGKEKYWCSHHRWNFTQREDRFSKKVKGEVSQSSPKTFAGVRLKTLLGKGMFPIKS